MLNFAFATSHVGGVFGPCDGSDADGAQTWTFRSDVHQITITQHRSASDAERWFRSTSTVDRACARQIHGSDLDSVVEIADDELELTFTDSSGTTRIERHVLDGPHVMVASVDATDDFPIQQVLIFADEIDLWIG